MSGSYRYLKIKKYILNILEGIGFFAAALSQIL